MSPLTAAYLFRGQDEFLRNNRGIDDGRDLEAAFMEELYDRIVSNEIRMKGGAEGERASVKGAAGSLAAAQFGIDLLRNLLPRRYASHWRYPTQL